MKIKLTAATTAALLLASAGAASAQSGDALVTVVHGVPGLTVDVYVDGSRVLDDFTYKTITDPVSLPAGDHEIEIYAGDADPAAAEPAITASVTLPAGANASAVAHLAADGTPTLTAFVNDVSELAAGEARVAVRHTIAVRHTVTAGAAADGTPTLTPFVNDVSTLGAGEARVAVRHTAAAPAVTVVANDAVTIAEGATNGMEAVVTVPADAYSVDVTVTDGGAAVFTDVPLALNEGTLTTVYAVGSADAGYELLTNTFSGLHSAPTGVPAGDAGLVDTSLPAWAMALMAAGALALGAPVVATARRRR